jgi:hypothetical protein
MEYVQRITLPHCGVCQHAHSINNAFKFVST